MDLFSILIDLPPEHMDNVTEALDLPAINTDKSQRESDTYISQVILPRIRVVSSGVTKDVKALSGGARNSLRDMEAGHRIQVLRSRTVAVLSDHYCSTRLSRDVL